MAATARKYDESSIERHAGLQGIRKKPTPYIGPPDSGGLWTIWREPADNTVDNALEGLNKLTHLIADSKPNRYWVRDEGSGIPVGKKQFEDEMGKKQLLSTFFVVTGLTHAGKNFNAEAISRGTHGIGIKATNALSDFFKVWTFRDGKWYAIEYAKGKLVKDVHVTKAPVLPHGIKATKGTVVCFEPDYTIFAKSAKIDMKLAVQWCQLSSYLVPGLTIKLTTADGKTQEFVSKDGVAGFLKQRVDELGCGTLGKPFIYTDNQFSIAIAFSDADGSDLVHAYTNGLRNKDGGVHLDAVYKALDASLGPYKGKTKFSATALRDGVIGLVDCKIEAPEFSGQTKEKMTDKRIGAAQVKDITAAFTAFWAKNKTMAKEVCKRASALHSAVSEFKENKRLMKELKGPARGSSVLLPGKLTTAKCAPEQREIYLVEGDSAAGTAKSARFKEYQEVLPLKGKIENAERVSVNKALSEQVVNILQAIGYDPNKDNPELNLRAHKVVILADPDIDGYHIQCLALTSIWKLVPKLITNGNVYVVAASEFKAVVKGKNVYANSLEEMAKKCGGTVPKDVLHIKGWGEVGPDVLREMAFDPKTRRLWRVTPPDGKQAQDVKRIMGEDPEYRKKMLGV